MPETTEGQQVMDYPAMPQIYDGARSRLAAIVAFFETRCPQCKEHYCPECTEKLGKLIVEAAEFLAETNN